MIILMFDLLVLLLVCLFDEVDVLLFVMSLVFVNVLCDE